MSAAGKTLRELIAEAKELCEIDYCFGQADRDAKERRAWSLISQLAALADQAQAEPDRRLQLAMQNYERWKAHAIELSARLQQYEPGVGMALNAAPHPAAQPVPAADPPGHHPV